MKTSVRKQTMIERQLQRSIQRIVLVRQRTGGRKRQDLALFPDVVTRDEQANDQGNIIDGGAGDNVILAGTGSDEVHGGKDNDDILGMAGSDFKLRRNT